jgi:hypothetical protein
MPAPGINLRKPQRPPGLKPKMIAGPETQNDNFAIATQYAVHLAQDRMRPVTEIQRMRQQNGIYGIAVNRQSVHIADDARLAIL